MSNANSKRNTGGNGKVRVVMVTEKMIIVVCLIALILAAWMYLRALGLYGEAYRLANTPCQWSTGGWP